MAAKRSHFRRIYLLLLIVGCVSTFVSTSSVDEDLTLTLSQKVTLDKFKERMVARGRLPHEYMKQDIYLIRWLRAKKFNMDQAEKLLLENLKWRKENNMDEILQEDFAEFEELYPYSLNTYARDGKPMLTGNFGDWDIRAIFIQGKMTQLIRYLAKMLEDATTKVRELQNQGKSVTQYDFLINMDNYNIAQHGCLQYKAKWTKALLDIADKSQLTPEYGGTYKPE